MRRLRGRGHGLSEDLRFLEAICFPGDFGKQITGGCLLKMKKEEVIDSEMDRGTLASRREVSQCSTPLRRRAISLIVLFLAY